MSYSNPVLPTGTSSGQSVYSVKTTAQHPVGTRGVLQDGRVFEYVRSKHATAIGKGKLAVYDPIEGGVDKLAMGAASAIGATTVSVTVTSTANLYEGSYLSIDDDAGEAELYRIISHPAVVSNETVFTLDRPLVVATTTNTTCTIVQNAAAVKISTAVTAQSQPVEVAAGVTLVDVGAGDTTNQYFWVQKQGIANVLFSAGVGAVGQPVYAGAVAGSFQIPSYDISAAADLTQFVALGTICALLPVSTEYHAVRLNIA